MKVALDEHFPKNVSKALKALSGEDQLLRVRLYSARDYSVPRAKSDVPWLERFAKAGGKVIISGDAKMRGKLHERQALIAAGFVVFFLARKWNQMRGHDKCAMLIHWWPRILEKLGGAEPGQFFEIPHSWTFSEMREVTPPTQLRQMPSKASGRKPAARRAGKRVRSPTPASQG